MADFLSGLQQGLAGFAAGTQNPGFAAERQAKQKAAQMSAIQLALERLDPNDPAQNAIREKLIPKATEILGPEVAQGLGAGIRPDPAGPQIKAVPATSRLLSIPPGGGAPTELVPAIPGAGGGRGVTSSELFQQNRARWLGLREKERTGNLSAKEKDEMDITFRKLTSQPNVMNMVMESALTGQPMGSISQPPQPTQTTGPQLTETQQGWIDNGRKAIAGGKDEEGVIEKIRQQTGLTREEIRSQL